MRDGYVTVSELNQYIKQRINEDENLAGLFVRGELSNFTHHRKSGHFYFTLKDEKASIRAVMFRGSAQYVRFQPENGMSVIVFGRVGYFERDGALQFYCEDMQPDGVGALYRAFEQLKQKLTQQGWFEESRKRPLPAYPQKIAVITAKGGAALQDIINIISRRYPVAEVVLLPAMVQGDQAPDSVADCLRRLSNHPEIDLVIVARGGGSLEDLWAFNTEKVAEAIYQCPVPVVSAVGHETDYTIADFVADLRAPTPSAAAELVTPEWSVLQTSLDSADKMLYNYMIGLLEEKEQQLQMHYTALHRLSPTNRIEILYKRLSEASLSMRQGAERRLERKTRQFLSNVELLNALSPLQVLTRGYSLTYTNGHLLKNENNVVPGQQITTKLQHGEIISEVTGYGGKKTDAGKDPR